MPTRLTKPLVRRINDRLVVRITSERVEFRGHRKRRWHALSWDQVASLLDDVGDAVVQMECASGRQMLAQIGALGDGAKGKSQKEKVS